MRLQIKNRGKKSLLQEVAGIEASLERIKQIIEPHEIHPKWLIFRDMYNEGGVVSRERWHELGRKYGYTDTRGLAGLTAFGKWVQRVAGNKFALTNDAIAELQKRGLIE